MSKLYRLGRDLGETYHSEELDLLDDVERAIRLGVLVPVTLREAVAWVNEQFQKAVA